MKSLKLFRWVGVLMLTILVAPSTASAQEAGTLSISGTLSMDYLDGERDLDQFAPDLVAVYVNGHEHTWTLTLHGTTQTHHTNGSFYGTEIDATSFDLKFFGPD